VFFIVEYPYARIAEAVSTDFKVTIVDVNGVKTHYSWKPISDLPPDFAALTDGELGPLHRVWMDQRRSLDQNGLLSEFTGQIQREWSIETGIIEQVYTLDRGITKLLIERGIDSALIPHNSTDKNPEHVARVIQDHADTLEAMFAFVNGQRELTVGYIKELHAALLQHQNTVTVVDQFGKEFEMPLTKGAYKTSPNNPTRPDGTVHEYCPPEHVASEMDQLVSLHRQHLRTGVPTEVESAWLHHAFTQIHPFEDGNGRVARALASLVFLRNSWFPLVITRDDRAKYIDALEMADAEDLQPLVALFVHSQRRSLIKATEIASEVKPPQTVDEAVAAARDRLVSKGQIVPKEWLRAKETADVLVKRTDERLTRLANQLRSEISVARLEFQFATRKGERPFEESLEIEKYQARAYKWSQLNLETERKATILVVFHQVGSAYLGIFTVTVALCYVGVNIREATDDFQINYEETVEQAQKRFDPWLEQSLINGLTIWRRSL
jgi:prophage maintenance system killer protein